MCPEAVFALRGKALNFWTKRINGLVDANVSRYFHDTFRATNLEVSLAGIDQRLLVTGSFEVAKFRADSFSTLRPLGPPNINQCSIPRNRVLTNIDNSASDPSSRSLISSDL